MSLKISFTIMLPSTFSRRGTGGEANAQGAKQHPKKGAVRLTF